MRSIWRRITGVRSRGRQNLIDVSHAVYFIKHASRLIVADDQKVANRLAMWPTARAGDARAGNVLVRVSARRAALLGLDAPTQLELTGRSGGPVIVGDNLSRLSDAELVARFERVRAAVECLRPEERQAETPSPERPSLEQRYPEALARRNGTGTTHQSSGYVPSGETADGARTYLERKKILMSSPTESS